jgi:hypothetical protein
MMEEVMEAGKVTPEVSEYFKGRYKPFININS